MSGEPPFVEYGGRIVAVAGRTRCYFAVDDLDEATWNFVAVMCLCKREVDEGRIEGPFDSKLAAKWARLVMIGPHNFTGRRDERRAGRPALRSHRAGFDREARFHEQVSIARRDFTSRTLAHG